MLDYARRLFKDRYLMLGVYGFCVMVLPGLAVFSVLLNLKTLDLSAETNRSTAWISDLLRPFIGYCGNSPLLFNMIGLVFPVIGFGMIAVSCCLMIFRRFSRPYPTSTPHVSTNQ
jgi:hypothetical protein